MNLLDTRSEIAETIAGKEKIVLQFSGGKDSTALLFVLKPWWDRLTLVFCNMGDTIPEVLDRAREFGKLCKEYMEVTGNAGTERAYPVDLLPMRATWIGRHLEPDTNGTALQSRFDCCFRNLWQPLMLAMQKMQPDIIMRAQRDSEELRNPIPSGLRNETGAMIYFPIRDWTQADVIEFLRAEGVSLPKYYEYTSSSLECMHCTAYQDALRGRYAYLVDFHPEAAKEYKRRMRLVDAEIMHVMREHNEAMLDFDLEAKRRPLE